MTSLSVVLHFVTQSVCRIRTIQCISGQGTGGQASERGQVKPLCVSGGSGTHPLAFLVGLQRRVSRKTGD